MPRRPRPEPTRFDWRTPEWITYLHRSIITSKSALWNLSKLDTSGAFRIATVYAWIYEGGRKTYEHTRVTIACAILPHTKGSNKRSIAKLEALKSKIISDELKKKRENIF